MMIKLSLMMLDRRSSLLGYGGQPRPPEDSLNVPPEGGLLGPIPIHKGARSISMGFGGANVGSNGAACCFFAFFHRCQC
jgi:hypothetical protein